MGKPFASELSALPSTIEWARDFDVASIKRFFDAARGKPLFAVGVGGSYTAARFAALLHSQRGGFGIAQTTYEFCHANGSLRDAHVVLFTGGGSNRDILSAFDCAIASEARGVLVVCASKASPIAARVQRYWYTTIAEFLLPTGRDGFLATNTLLATCMLIARAFDAAADGIRFNSRSAAAADASGLRLSTSGREQLIVLTGGYGTPAGVDLESKCSEAALASVMLSDYRHFAHGRHVWLAKRPDAVAVIALVTPAERDIFEKTRALIPPAVPVVRLTAPSSDSRSTIALLCDVFHFVAGFGKGIDRDPGRPGVPAFGRQVYHLRTNSSFPGTAVSAKGVEDIACRRKSAAGGERSEWETEFRQFLNALQRARFTAIVFDFDGTLCGARDRFIGVTEALQKPLADLLRHGVRLVIATGRGDSCRDALRKIFPKRYWRRVVVGYHNGSDVSTLEDVSVPQDNDVAVEPLAALADALSRRKVAKSCDVRLHRCQMTIKPERGDRATYVARAVEEVIAAQRLPLRMVYSSHSFDVLACDASKINVLERGLSAEDTPLCIGDRGAWPGNDFELLQTPLSLSVDEVSSDRFTCWNLAPAGVKCEQATLFYLLGLQAARGSMRYSLKRSLSRYRALLR